MCCCTLKSLWCMTLHTAGMVIGWFSAVISLLKSLIYIAVLVNVDKIVELLPQFNEQHDSRLDVAVLTGISALFSMQLGHSLLNLAASVLVIIGTTKNSHLMLLPWLLHNGFTLVFLTILNFGFFVSLLDQNNAGIAFVIISIILVIFWLAWTSILSLFRNIRATRDANKHIGPNNYELFNNSNNSENGIVKVP